MPSPLPLSGLKVVDLTRVLAGPFCAMLLGDMGADVIKVEEPSAGDDARAWAPFVGDWSAYFLGVNRSKRSLALDLKSAEGAERAAAPPRTAPTCSSRTSSRAASTSSASASTQCAR